MLQKYNWMLAPVHCCMLPCPIHYKSIGEIQKDNPCCWAFSVPWNHSWGTWKDGGSYGTHRPSVPQHLLLSYCFRATQLFCFTDCVSEQEVVLTFEAHPTPPHVAKFWPWCCIVKQLAFHGNLGQNRSVLTQCKVGSLNWYPPIPPTCLSWISNGNIHLLNKLYWLGLNEKIIFFVLILHCDFYVFIYGDSSLHNPLRVPTQRILCYDQLW